MVYTANANESGDAKEKALASLKELKEIIREKESYLLVLAKDKELQKVGSKNSCWWDAKPCLNYSETAGFQEVGTFCNGCSRVDQERFAFILEQIVPDLLRFYKNEAEEKTNEEIKLAKAEASSEVWQEIHEEILGVIAEFEEEN